MMTSEKAIQLLHRLSDEQFDGVHGDERREALSMAVRALEQNLGNNGSICTKTRANDEETGVNDEDRTTDDLISRKMTIETITRISGIRGDVLKALYELPSAQPQCKKGKWEVLYPNDIYKYHCSECGAYHRAMYDFCPSCGADMRGEGNDDN